MTSKKGILWLTHKCKKVSTKERFEAENKLHNLMLKNQEKRKI